MREGGLVSVFFFLCICIPPSTKAVIPSVSHINALPNRDSASGEMEDIEFRFFIEPYKTECFYQLAKKDHNLEINYQVVDAKDRLTPTNRGDLTINMIAKDPAGVVIIEDFGRQEGSFVHKTTQFGEHSICFMNGVTTKLINLEVYLFSDEDDDRWGYLNEVTFAPDVQYEDSIESIKTSLNKVRDSLTKVVHHQVERQAVERRDRLLAEDNLRYVNRFSFLSMIVVIIVGLVQLVFIRSMFEDKGILKKILKSTD